MKTIKNTGQAKLERTAKKGACLAAALGFSLLSAVLQLETLYQQPLMTCLHHHLVSTAVSRLNYYLANGVNSL